MCAALCNFKVPLRIALRVTSSMLGEGPIVAYCISIHAIEVSFLQSVTFQIYIAQDQVSREQVHLFVAKMRSLSIYEMTETDMQERPETPSRKPACLIALIRAIRRALCKRKIENDTDVYWVPCAHCRRYKLRHCRNPDACTTR